MKHTMTLFKEPFESIITGNKKIEVRLNDEKRRVLQIGDVIEFQKLPERTERIQVVVQELLVFETFREMYEAIPFHEFDCEGWTMQEMLDGTYDIYTPEQEAQWGVLGIRIERM